MTMLVELRGGPPCDPNEALVSDSSRYYNVVDQCHYGLVNVYERTTEPAVFKFANCIKLRQIER